MKYFPGIPTLTRDCVRITLVNIPQNRYQRAYSLRRSYPNFKRPPFTSTGNTKEVNAVKISGSGTALCMRTTTTVKGTILESLWPMAEAMKQRDPFRRLCYTRHPYTCTGHWVNVATDRTAFVLFAVFSQVVVEHWWGCLLRDFLTREELRVLTTISRVCVQCEKWQHSNRRTHWKRILRQSGWDWVVPLGNCYRKSLTRPKA